MFSLQVILMHNESKIGLILLVPASVLFLQGTHGFLTSEFSCVCTGVRYLYIGGLIGFLGFYLVRSGYLKEKKDRSPLKEELS